MKNYLIPRYNTPMLQKLVSPTIFPYRSKFGHIQFSKWLTLTYPNTYADVKEGDCFILYNGTYTPVPFAQIRDEKPDKANRPTRLSDGNYLYLPKDARVWICTKADIRALKDEIKLGLYQK